MTPKRMPKAMLGGAKTAPWQASGALPLERRQNLSYNFVFNAPRRRLEPFLRLTASALVRHNPSL
jgi:hypothetical protein